MGRWNRKVAWKIRNVQLIQYGLRLYLQFEKSLPLKKKLVLYYLDEEYTPSRGFVREEFMHVDADKIQYPPQRILSENQPTRLVHTTRVSGNQQRQRNMLKGVS